MSEALHENYERLRQWGFAEGNYWNYCSECGVQHTADKRAWRCLSCAEKRADLVEAAVKAERERLADTVREFLSDEPIESLDAYDSGFNEGLFKAFTAILADREKEAGNE